MRPMLNIYSFGYAAGFLRERGVSDNHRMTLDQAARLAVDCGLSGLEFPVDNYFQQNEMTKLREFLAQLASLKLDFFLDLETFDNSYLATLLPVIRDFGKSHVRIKMKHLGPVFFGGNRFEYSHFQKSFMEFRSQLKAALPLLEDFQAMVLIENHQDISGAELAKLVGDISSKHVGITWDIGNSTAVADSPCSFFARCKNYIRHVHLKDYFIYPTADGFKLTRCPIGDGFVDMGKMIRLLGDLPWPVTASIELGAQKSRECKVNNPGYWQELLPLGYDPAVFRDFVAERTIDNPEGCSAWEKGAPEGDVIASEVAEFMKSAQFFTKPGGQS